jgi:hypothetical protein
MVLYVAIYCMVYFCMCVFFGIQFISFKETLDFKMFVLIFMRVSFMICQLEHMLGVVAEM